jgi:hypothetical protein
MAWRAIVSGGLAQHIAEKCDRLTQECDHLLESAQHIDAEIGRLSASAHYMMIQVGLLGLSQVNLGRQLRTLSWRLFWSNLRPTFILARLSRALGPHRHPRRRRHGPNVHADRPNLTNALSALGYSDPNSSIQQHVY